MNQNSQIRKYIKERRQQLDMSQKSCAKELGIPRPSWTLIESGKRDISFEEFKDLVKILHIPLDVVLELLDLDSTSLNSRLININNVIQDTYYKLEEIQANVFEQIRGTGKSP
jgi:transcriptional regulator with XRE-family HTH domain